ncbi:TIGR03086 family metal-binding protein [Georgenia sp. Z1491]|uniref:TIGR03086 family metal-binding protein n=1 Tax=Georgenia sp. Z1491 TaxID=3416707 RepID=UPI003CEDE90A
MRDDDAPADLHRQVAAGFSAVVDGVAPGAWDAPSPVEGWAARDVVGHLTTWLPTMLAASGGPALPEGPDADIDPAGAWHHQRRAVQAILDDPASADQVLINPNFGEVPLPGAISRFYVGDVFMHTWDLARATGQEPGLDAELSESLLAGMAQMEDVLRSSGQYGPPVPVPGDASAQDRLVGFIGRDPAWEPPADR